MLGPRKVTLSAMVKSLWVWSSHQGFACTHVLHGILTSPPEGGTVVIPDLQVGELKLEEDGQFACRVPCEVPRSSTVSPGTPLQHKHCLFGQLIFPALKEAFLLGGGGARTSGQQGQIPHLSAAEHRAR